MLGGGERYPLALARALSRHLECELVSFGPHAREWREPGGLRLRILPAPFTLYGHPAHRLAPALPAVVAHADLIHTHHMRSTASRIAALTARALGRATAVTDHGLSGSDWGGLLQRCFDRFLLVSACSARLLHAPRLRTRIIYGGADPLRYYPDPDVPRAGVLFLGRITPHKGIDRLIEALPRDASLRIAGSTGHDRQRPERDYPLLLRRLAAGRAVEFLGPIPDAQLPALLRSAQVLVLPSVHRTCYGRWVPVSELLGLVLLEAMASGTPVIASRVGGMIEVVEHGTSGFLVEPGNILELRYRLAELLGDRELAQAMGRRARELALERFTWEHCAARCLAVYSEMDRRRKLRNAFMF